jgi:hypothetical protein
MRNGCTDERMNLNDVCEWLTNQGYNELGDIIKDKFSYHTWTKDGMTRKDVIKEIFERCFDNTLMFRELECDVITYMNIVPLHEAHVD